MTLSRYRLPGVMLALVLALVSPAPSASAQGYGLVQDTQAAAPGFFYFARPDEPVISVTVVGATAVNGVFYVGTQTDVGDILALAGGVRSANGEEPTIRVFKDGVVTFESSARQLYDETRTVPVLKNGDVIEASVLTSTVVGYHIHSRPGEQTVTATASGALNVPGIYVLSQGMDVGDLIGIAGGGQTGIRDSRTEVTSTVRVYRGGGILLESSLTDLYARPTPVLQTGDVVDLEIVSRQRSSFTWRDGLTIGTSVLAVVVAVFQLTRN